MNNRNLGFIYPHNQRRDFPLANNKLLCKETLSAVGVAVPGTHFSYSYFYELRNIQQELSSLDDFVIKPANGSGGNGIVVIVKKVDGGWCSAGGSFYGIEEIKKHISDIIFGVYSHGMQDTAVIEQRIVQHERMNVICDLGLADVRIILFNDQPVMAMSRIPTSESDGKANLHQGAIGLGINIETGRTQHAIKAGVAITHHPDSQQALLDVAIPHWQAAMLMAVKAAKAVPLKYLGVDIAIAEQGPVLIEINARPGIEIQNANNTAMRLPLDKILNDSYAIVSGSSQ
jgi:alpha-L-glutamate ligase-like protein